MQNNLTQILLSNISSEVQGIESRIKEMESEILKLRKRAVALRDQSAAIKDARAGIYDKWYRNHREDNTYYDKAWDKEKRVMELEGYEDGWQVIEG